MIAMILQAIGMTRDRMQRAPNGDPKATVSHSQTKDGKSKTKVVLYIVGGIIVIMIVGGVIVYIASKTGLLSKITDPLGLFKGGAGGGFFGNLTGGLGGGTGGGFLGNLTSGLSSGKLGKLGGGGGLKLGGVWKGLPSKSVKTTFKRPNLFKKAPQVFKSRKPTFKPQQIFKPSKKSKKFKLF